MTVCCASSSVEATVGAPQVAYKETIRRSAPRPKAAMSVRLVVTVSSVTAWIELTTRASRALAVTFENKIVGGVIPKEFIAPIEDGVREAAQNGLHGRLRSR